eukprot:265988-Prorocentrum_minimum.AAC.6
MASSKVSDAMTAMFYRSYMWMMTYVSFMKCFVNDLIQRVMTTPNPMQVYKVIKYHIRYPENSGEGDEGDDEEEDVTATYLRGEALCCEAAPAAAAAAAAAAARVDKSYSWVEYRCMWRGRFKYRYVVPEVPEDPRTGTRSPCYDMFVSSQLQTRVILLATLCNERTKHVEDVTRRVKKFAGPRQDFFETSGMRMGWMFVHDDLEEDTELQLLMLDRRHGRHVVLTYGRDDVIAL